MPRGVKIGVWMCVGLLMSGALYLYVVRGNAMLLDLANLTRTVFCF